MGWRGYSYIREEFVDGRRQIRPRLVPAETGEWGGGRPKIGHEYTNGDGVDIRVFVMNSWMAGNKSARNLSLPRLASVEVAVHD